jgi:hypothetical protein
VSHGGFLRGFNVTTFCECGAPIKGNFKKCFKCQLNAKYTEGYELGYGQGVLAAERVSGAKSASLSITKERWRQLAQLCHPDKHGGSATAVDVQTWLNEVKPE